MPYKLMCIFCQREDCIYNEDGECDCPIGIYLDEYGICEDYEESEEDT